MQPSTENLNEETNQVEMENYHNDHEMEVFNGNQSQTPPLEPFSENLNNSSTPINSTDCFLCSHKENTINDLKASIESLKSQISKQKSQIADQNLEVNTMKQTIQEYRNSNQENEETCIYCYVTFGDSRKLQNHLQNCAQFGKKNSEAFVFQDHGMSWKKKPCPGFQQSIAKHYVVQPIKGHASQEEDLRAFWDEAITF